MNEPALRKVQVESSRVYSSAGQRLEDEYRAGSIAAVVTNPLVAGFASEVGIETWMRELQPLADELAAELRDELACDGRRIESYGKGAIVGVNGDLELAAAWHVPGGAGLRSALAQPNAMVPSSKKVGLLGAQLDVPMVHIHASYLRSHYDVHPVVVADAPRPDEIVYALVMSTGPRPHHRIGGFTIDEVEGTDGLR